MKKKRLLKELNLSSYVAIDFETTGLDPNHDKIIEVAAILFKDGEPKKTFSTLVNPGKNIPSFITGITGISNSMVSQSPKESEIINDLMKIIGSHPVVAHNVKFDWSFIESLCKRYNLDIPSNPLYDTLQLARSVLFDHPVFNLSALSEFYGLDASGSHRAEKDTENCGIIFLHLLDELMCYNLEEISKVLSIIDKYEIPNKKLYVDTANLLIKSGDLKDPIKKRLKSREYVEPNYEFHGNEDIKNLTASDVFGLDGVLSNKYNWFEDRANQVEYANTCDDILSSNKSGVLEAGTGLGKSMGYLFSAIKRKYETDSRGPVVIACNTKHLQDQLFYKDLPKLTEALNTSVKAVLIKGRKNYLCRTRFDWFVSDRNNIKSSDVEVILPIVFWLQQTKSGDLSECNGFFNSRRAWIASLICSDTGFCTGDICGRNNGCYYGPLRKSLYEADILVANHSLLLTDAKVSGILPEHDTVIIDEVHNLVKGGYDQFKINLDYNGVMSLLRSINPSNPRSRRWNNILLSIEEGETSLKLLKEKLINDIDKVKISFELFMEDLSRNSEGQFDISKAYQERPIIQSISKEYSSLSKSLSSFSNNSQSLLVCFINLRNFILKIDANRSKYLYLHSILDKGLENLNILNESISLLTQNQNNEWVYWKEGFFSGNKDIENQLQVSLHASKIDISEELRNNLYEKNSNIILTSATIKVEESFGYFLQRNGLTENDNIITRDYVSPFSYQDQVKYFQYGGSKDITSDINELSDLIYHVHKTFNKRTMVLFTSVRMLENVSKKIKERLGGKKIPLFAQSRGASKPSIIKGMHSNENALLFGTNSFWEGVDLPGELLEILIVVKLPFDVPSDPLIKSYSNYLDVNGINSFMNYTIPECAIRFRQGFGRLIRTTFDSGIFISLDNRIVTKRYGDVILNSIPADPQIFKDYHSIQ